jgi:hypothetical protein
MKKMRAGLRTAFVILFLGGPAGWVLAQTPAKSKIEMRLDQLSAEKTGYEKYTHEKSKVRDRIQQDVMSQLNQSEDQNAMARDQRRADNYKADILNDEAYLKRHWKKMTPDQQNRARQLEEEME